MLFTLLFSFQALAVDYQFHMMEDGQIWPSVQCLPKIQQEYLKSTDREVSVSLFLKEQGKDKYQHGEKRSVWLSNTTGILKECNLERLQVFFDGKLYPMGKEIIANYVEKETGGDCGYKVPRLELSFGDNQIKNGFVLAPEFSVLNGKEKEKVEEDFNKAADAAHKADKGYWSRPEAVFQHRLEKDAVFVVTDQTEMGKVMALYRRKGKKWEKVDSASFEPCGS